jgi:dihydroorotate dehydrogenase (NAD+) catalytic subunit
MGIFIMKRDLYFSKPLMNAAGTLGFAPDPRSGIDLASFGAFVTNPISLRLRLPTGHPTLIGYPGGFLLHTGLPNPGFKNVLKKYSARWERADLPIIVHLMADRPEETRYMTRILENVENVMAVELGFAPFLSNDLPLLTLEMCLGELPLIFSLPNEQVLTLGPRLIQYGAQAISIAAPRGTLSENGTLVTGRLYGPALFPTSLEIVHSAAMIGVPIIGAGGVWKDSDVTDMLSAGANAVQTGASLWLPRTSSSKREAMMG